MSFTSILLGAAAKENFPKKCRQDVGRLQRRAVREMTGSFLSGFISPLLSFTKTRPYLGPHRKEIYSMPKPVQDAYEGAFDKLTQQTKRGMRLAKTLGVVVCLSVPGNTFWNSLFINNAVVEKSAQGMEYAWNHSPLEAKAGHLNLPVLVKGGEKLPLLTPLVPPSNAVDGMGH